MTGRHLLTSVRLAVGPLALVAFWLPWYDGYVSLNGPDIARVGRTWASGVAPGEGWTVLVAAIALPVAAAVHLLLSAARAAWHPAYWLAAAVLVVLPAALATALWDDRGTGVVLGLAVSVLVLATESVALAGWRPRQRQLAGVPAARTP